MTVFLWIALLNFGVDTFIAAHEVASGRPYGKPYCISVMRFIACFMLVIWAALLLLGH